MVERVLDSAYVDDVVFGASDAEGAFTLYKEAKCFWRREISSKKIPNR